MNVLRRHWRLFLATLAIWWLVSVPVTFELAGYSERDDSFAYFLGLTLLRFFPFAALIPTLYGMSGRYRLSFATLGLHILGAAIYGALACVTFTVFELSLREGARRFVESYLELLPGRLAYGTLVYGFVYGMSRAVHYYREGSSKSARSASKHSTCFSVAMPT